MYRTSFFIRFTKPFNEWFVPQSSTQWRRFLCLTKKCAVPSLLPTAQNCLLIPSLSLSLLHLLTWSVSQSVPLLPFLLWAERYRAAEQGGARKANVGLLGREIHRTVAVGRGLRGHSTHQLEMVTVPASSLWAISLLKLP